MEDKTPLFRRTVTLILKIPKGKVTSYGRIAELISAPGCGRHVSFILSSSSKKYKLPWHRVVSSDGKIANHGATSVQRRLLMKEGVEVDGKSIDLDEYLWKPTKKEINSLLKGIPKHKSIFLRNRHDY